jgi:hypothetical protein
MVDTGAFSIWVSEAVYEEVGTMPIIPGGGASAADGRALPVLGEGRMQLGVWGRSFYVPVKIMRILPAGILIGKQLLVKHGVLLDFGKGRGSFTKHIGGRRVQYEGRLLLDPAEPHEDVMEVIEADDVAAIIADLDLTDLGKEAEPMRKVLLRHIDIFKG